MNDGGRTRRAVLRAAGGGAVALSTSTAGCLGLFGGGSDDTLSSWLAAPDALGAGRYEFHRTDYAALVADDGPFGEQARRYARKEFGGDGGVLDRERIEAVIGLDPDARRVTGGFVVLGSFDADAIGERLTDQVDGEVTEDGTRRDHDLYTVTGDDGDVVQAIGVGADSVVASETGEDARAVVRTLHDARAGTVDRYGKVDDSVGTLLDGLDGSLYVGGGPGPTGTEVGDSFPDEDAVVAGGLSADLDGETVSFERLYVYEDADTAESADVSDWRELLASRSAASGLSVGRSGRTMIVSGSVPAETVRAGPRVSLSVLGAAVLSVAFDFGYRAQDGVVTVSHQGGDPLSVANTERLRVDVDGERATVWFDGGGDSVVAGDRTEVAADPGSTVEVVWVPLGGTEGVVIESFTVPE